MLHKGAQRIVSRCRTLAECSEEDGFLTRTYLSDPMHDAHARLPVHRMPGDARHDAMVLAPHVPSAMPFLRSPCGVSHQPDESVREEDVAAALPRAADFLSSVSGVSSVGATHA